MSPKAEPDQITPSTPAEQPAEVTPPPTIDPGTSFEASDTTDQQKTK